MSTRSGTRLHSYQDDVENTEEEAKVEKKKRNKRKKDVEEIDIGLRKGPKRNNYVAYPSNIDDDARPKEVEKAGRKLRRKTFKELNDNLTSIESGDATIEVKKPLRVTRRTRRFADENETGLVSVEIQTITSTKARNKKKKKSKSSLENVPTEAPAKEQRKKKKKKEKKDKVCLQVEKRQSNILNGSCVSVESFHSAAGSPHEVEDESQEVPTVAEGTALAKDSKDLEHVLNTLVVEKRSSLKTSTIKDDVDTSLVTLPRNTRSNSLKSNNSLNKTFDKVSDTILSNESVTKTLNKTFDKDSNTSEDIKMTLNGTYDKDKHNSTFDVNELKSDSKSSLLSSDRSNITLDKSSDKSNPRISITSDDSESENILNATPVLIESSMETSTIINKLNESYNKTEDDTITPVTPLKREGTFTKDGPDVVTISPKVNTLDTTPTRRASLPSPGRTPYLSNGKVKEKSQLNITRSIEKSRRSSLLEPIPRATRVMFCSPVNNPKLVSQRKSKVIKSNLKGSNKSFVFEENATRPAIRKRSYTQNDEEVSRAKRKRLGDELQQSVDRLSRPRTSSATPKASEPLTPLKKTPNPYQSKSETKVSRAKLPNFAALHQREFAKMESLNECQERKAKRAKQLLVPSGSLAVLERNSPKGITNEPVKSATKNQNTPFTFKSATETKPKDGYTRFGFKLNLEKNPFSIQTKATTTIKPKEKPKVLKREATLPSLTGTTAGRKETAKQAIMREKSFNSLTEKRNVYRKETRTIIKGVRTNRRFELQMQSRNIKM